MKPVASGAEPTAAGLRNEDALRLQAQASRPIAYGRVNPVVYAAPVAPHIAAERAGEPRIPLAPIVEAFELLQRDFDRIIVEGVGGWRVPLGPGRWDVAALADRFGLPVVLVVGLRLGCLNHAILTAESIRNCGTRLAGWVGSVGDPSMDELDANVDALRERLPVPCFGVIPWLSSPTPDRAADFLDWPPDLDRAGAGPRASLR